MNEFEANDKEFEKRYKEELFTKIEEVRTKLLEAIQLLNTNCENLSQSQIDIPNVGITLNNKLVEMYQSFNNAQVPFFSVGIVGNAVIHDLMDKLNESVDKLLEFEKTVTEISKNKSDKVLALQNVSPIKKWFLKIRSFFVPKKSIDLSLTEKEEATFNQKFNEYKDIDNQIWNYDIEENIVQAIVKELAGPQKNDEFCSPYQYDASSIPGVLEKLVIPDLKKLGLEHLVPNIKEALIEEYKKDLPDPEIYQVKDEDMYLFVPDFTKKSQDSQLEDTTYKKEDKISDEIDLNGFKAIDLDVSANQRQAAVKSIRAQLSQDKSIEGEKLDLPYEKEDGAVKE